MPEVERRTRDMDERNEDDAESEDGGVTAEEVESLGRKLEEKVKEEDVGGRRVSMAALQGLFIRSGPREAVARCEVLFKDRQTG